ncbi:hypothetical protein PEC301877_06110 [Pectobacterium carotovorum subsp. carotovorum]|nr:hypothetical protein PEC301877_06110 [Pectobacterium carotovorum subsp. carotovorum]
MRDHSQLKNILFIDDRISLEFFPDIYLHSIQFLVLTLPILSFSHVIQ